MSRRLLGTSVIYCPFRATTWDSHPIKGVTVKGTRQAGSGGVCRTAHGSSPHLLPYRHPESSSSPSPPRFLQPPGRGPRHVLHDGPSGGFRHSARGLQGSRGQHGHEHPCPRLWGSEACVSLGDGPQSRTCGSRGNSPRRVLRGPSRQSALARWEVCHLPTNCPRQRSRTSFM